MLCYAIICQNRLCIYETGTKTETDFQTDERTSRQTSQESKRRATVLYDLADSAYDAEDIKNFSRKLGHVPIIDINNAEVMRYRFLLPKSADTVNVPA